jgi:hypothetical protein
MATRPRPARCWRARALGPEAPSVDVLEARLHAAAGRYRQALAALDRARTRGATWGPRWEDERARYAQLAGAPTQGSTE